MRRVVVLPAPFGPRKPCTSPRCTDNSSPSRARVGPNVFTSPEIAIAADMVHTVHFFHKGMKSQNDVVITGGG